ncbi:hypothetical protein V6R21_20050 [Limibacter armeniacum]|uniref:hypothetical protein n=1 Tax=Limibacter armeniacum TaxID=466084 RepID=UPI002FE57B2D
MNRNTQLKLKEAGRNYSTSLSKAAGKKTDICKRYILESKLKRKLQPLYIQLTETQFNQVHNRINSLPIELLKSALDMTIEQAYTFITGHKIN